MHERERRDWIGSECEGLWIRLAGHAGGAGLAVIGSPRLSIFTCRDPCLGDD